MTSVQSNQEQVFDLNSNPPNNTHVQLDARNWNVHKKILITFTISVTGFNRIMVSTMMAPALPYVMNDLNLSKVAVNMTLSIFVLATCIGPLFFGPLSELYGRRWLLHGSNLWFLIWNFACGFAKDGSTMLLFRFFAGIGASAIYSLSSGVLSDIWKPEQRGKTLSLYLFIPLLAAGVGPMIGGFIVGSISWRWIFWMTSVLQVILVLFAFLFFEETHLPTIITAKTGLTRFQQNRNSNDLQISTQTVYHYLFRPFTLLVSHPIMLINALLSAFEYGVLYWVLATLAEMFQTNYQESATVSGLNYLAVCAGELSGALIGGCLMDKTFQYLKERQIQSRQGHETELTRISSIRNATLNQPHSDPPSHHPRQGIPELHIPILLPASLLTPIGLFLYGWAAQKHYQWAVVDLGIFILSFGGQIAGQCLSAYVMDSFPIYSSSAMSAVQFFRSMAAFTFPLFAPPLQKVLGYGWSNSLIAILSFLITVPAAPLIWRFGRQLRLRQNSV